MAVAGGPVETEEFKPFASHYSTVQHVPFVSPIKLGPVQRPSTVTKPNVRVPRQRRSVSTERKPYIRTGRVPTYALPGFNRDVALAELDALMAQKRANLAAAAPKPKVQMSRRRFDHAEARRLRSEGLSWRALANHLGVTPTAVRRACSDAQSGS
jgi:hypothetical protein